TEPLINLRYAVDRLVRSATLSRDAGDGLVEAGARMHYTQRTYGAILGSSPLAGSRDAEDLIRLLRSFDLKRDDAQFLLETLAQVEPAQVEPAHGAAAAAPAAPSPADAPRALATEDRDAPVLIWESGDSLAYAALLRF